MIGNSPSCLDNRSVVRCKAGREGKAGQDRARQGKARQGKTRQDKTRQDKTRQDKRNKYHLSFVRYTVNRVIEGQTDNKIAGDGLMMF